MRRADCSVTATNQKRNTEKTSPGIVNLFLHGRKGKAFKSHWKSFEGCQSVVEQSRSSLRKPQTWQRFQELGCVSNDGEKSTASRLLLFSCSCLPFLLSLNVKATAAVHWAVCSDVGLHLPHPGHIPVPRGNLLLLPKQVAVWSQRGIQEAEGRSWRREVWEEKDVQVKC